MEEWKDIVDYEGLYQISNLGNIKSIRKDLLKQQLGKDGYYDIQLSKNSNIKSYLVHRLVAIHFVQNTDLENKLFVNHKDGIKTNNFYKNLEWVTRKENMEHAVRENLIKNGDKSPLKGNKNACKILMDILTGKQYNSINEAAKDLNIGRSYLGCMLTGRNKNITNLVYLKQD